MAERKMDKEMTFAVLPVVYFTPETKWVFGVGGVSTFNLDSISTTYESQLTAGLAYSLRNQFLSYVSGRIFSPKNRSLWYGEMGWYDYVFFYFGQGMNVNQDSEEIYSAKFPRLRFNYVRNIGKNWFLGGGFRFDGMNIFELQEDGALANGEIIGSQGGRNSGLGPLILHDSRNNQLYPESGVYFEAGLQAFGGIFGGEFSYVRAISDFRKILPLGKNQVFAAQAFSEITFGDVPFFALPMLGGNKLLRGLFEGKYREKNLFALQAEYRYKFLPRWGIVAFGGTGNAFSSENPLHFNLTKITYGVGGRFQLNQEKKLNLRLDLAHSPGEPFQFYFTFGEAF
ncbi:BamA/TamA family outer membrane protein [Algoriphagus mannitolivorans]|uniref:BamA/TamA family outer membrane protein n=1 Tax=Algoriphagus mannitolivorans TaxID=226504 RepID=UPI00146FB723|nr:BamA/TamA family outer membrane protein [Algoriphagus mannitolivorans]